MPVTIGLASARYFSDKAGMYTAFLVFLGGGAGSVLRWLTGLAAMRAFGMAFPVGTLVVNILGALVMGILARQIVTLPTGSTLMNADDARVFLMTGMLGGFTTFSAFSLDAATLWLRGETLLAAFYVIASVAGSLGAIAFGLWLGGSGLGGSGFGGGFSR